MEHKRSGQSAFFACFAHRNYLTMLKVLKGSPLLIAPKVLRPRRSISPSILELLARCARLAASGVGGESAEATRNLTTK